VLYLQNDKERDGSSTDVWLGYMLLMVMNQLLLESEISSGGEL
jgi:hypothetical protein